MKHLGVLKSPEKTGIILRPKCPAIIWLTIWQSPHQSAQVRITRAFQEVHNDRPLDGRAPHFLIAATRCSVPNSRSQASAALIAPDHQTLGWGRIHLFYRFDSHLCLNGVRRNSKCCVSALQDAPHTQSLTAPCMYGLMYASHENDWKQSLVLWKQLLYRELSGRFVWGQGGVCVCEDKDTQVSCLLIYDIKLSGNAK